MSNDTMKRIYKILILLGFILFISGIFYIYSNIPHHRTIVINNDLLFGVAYSFFYLEPVIGIILLIGLRKRREKYFGLLFLLVWIFAVWLDIYRYTH